MSRIIVKTLAEEFHAAFEGQRVHSLIGNLEGFDPAMWRAKPQEGARSVGGLVWHAGCAKYLHHSHTFGDRSVTWAHPLCAIDNARDMDAALVWLREGHRLFMDALLQLSDSDLDLDRPTWFGDTRPIRETVGSMTRHDAYHAGEINHLRALLEGSDAWEDYDPSVPGFDRPSR
jgi:uncharacterized damage-inducible protein DinB